MAVTPIDLQTMFLQLDKIGKDIANQKEGAELREAMRRSIESRKAEARSKSVHEADDSGEGPARTRDSNKKSARGGGRREAGQEAAEEEDEKKLTPLSDPKLGKWVDISG